MKNKANFFLRTGGIALALTCGILAVCTASGPRTSAAPLISPAAVDGRIGLELADIANTAQPVFVDAMKQAAPWSASGDLRLDAHGDALALAPGQSAQTVVCAGGAYPAGDYVLLFDGAGTLSLDTGTIIERSPGRIIVRLMPAAAGVRLRLSATDPHNYVRNIRFIAPGFEATYARAPFFPSYVAALVHLHVLRFAHWARANASTGSLDWSTRSNPSMFTQAVGTGVAPEYLIALANATGNDPWFVFPAGVTDAYVTGFATLVRAMLNPRLHPSFEYGEAMWVPGSPDQRYATLAGLSTGLTFAPAAAAPAWYALRSTQIFARLTAAYGLEAARFHRVLSVPLAYPGTPNAALVKSLLASSAARFADVVAVPDIPPAGSIAQRMPQVQALKATAALAQHSGLALWSNAADVLAPAGNATQASVRVLYDNLFNDWHAAGGGLAVTSSSGLAGKWAGVADALQRYPMPHVQAATAVLRAAPLSLPVSAPAAILAPGSDVIAIDCGGPASGNFIADTDYSTPSSAFSENSAPIVTSSIMAPAPQAVYKSQRSSHGTPLTYTIPGLTAGTAYTVRLHFAEIAVNGIGDRIFNVSVNGNPVLTNFDVQATAGGFETAVIENFYATASSSGQITIVFTGVVGDPIVNGIEIQMPGPIDVLAINAGGAATGGWLADTDFSGGNTYSQHATPIVTTGVVNPAPQAVYQSERFSGSTFTYSIPGLKPGATYRVRLHFAEMTVTQKGARIFNVSINGKQVLTNFDIFARAGGEFRAIVEQYSVSATSSGQIAIAFTPVTSDPQINGIEIQALPTIDAAAIAAGGTGTGVWAANTDATTLITTTTATITTSGVSSPAPQAVYQAQRFMNAGALTFAIPGLQPNASYVVRLHFAELTATAAGQRVFNVGINDKPALKKFDIYAAAGGQNQAIVQSFNAQATSSGQIVIALTNVVGNPAVNGIEIVTPNTPAPTPAPTPTPNALCIAGTSYTPTQDDEFSQDTSVHYSPDLILATPQPDGSVWSSRAWGFVSDYSRNNIGTDDAYYTDPTRGLGPYSPYSLGGGALTITAVPVPAPYATASPLLGAHWLSGLLESPTLSYGYIEVAAALPNLQGQFSSPLWLLGANGSDGNGNGYEELDVNEMFGDTYAPGNVLFETNHYIPPSPGSQPVIDHEPVEAELNSTSAYHVYGVLWTPSVVRFYVDRQPTSPDYVNGSFGPMHAIISLGVFTQTAFAPGPPNQLPETMSLQYYRWYQPTTNSCSGSQLPS